MTREDFKKAEELYEKIKDFELIWNVFGDTVSEPKMHIMINDINIARVLTATQQIELYDLVKDKIKSYGNKLAKEFEEL